MPTLIARGQYFSQTNVHNPSRFQTVTFRKKFAVALPLERPGDVSKYFTATLKADEALQIDCGDIFQHLGIPPSSFVEGFAVIESPLELDVDTVYTAANGCDSAVSSIHTERVAPRRLQLCQPLNLKLTTGTAPWQVIAESQAGGPLPRPANVYSTLPSGAGYIGGLSKVDLALKPAWWDFQLCFCLCSGAQNVKLNLAAAQVDDEAELFLNGPPSIGTLPLGTAPAATLAAINNAATQHFRPGQNCLRVRLTNKWPNGAGIGLLGSITGADAACPAGVVADTQALPQ